MLELEEYRPSELILMPQRSTTMTTQPVPFPEDLVLPRSSGKCYIATKGLFVGIFRNWQVFFFPQSSFARVSNPSHHNCHKSYLTWKEALDAYTSAYEQGAVEIRQRTGTASPNAKAHGVVSPIPKPKELEPFDSEEYYVAIAGSRVGIFKHWYICLKQYHQTVL
jgi:hypothetical protein